MPENNEVIRDLTISVVCIIYQYWFLHTNLGPTSSIAVFTFNYEKNAGNKCLPINSSVARILRVSK